MQTFLPQADEFSTANADKWLNGLVDKPHHGEIGPRAGFNLGRPMVFLGDKTELQKKLFLGPLAKRTELELLVDASIALQVAELAEGDGSAVQPLQAVHILDHMRWF